MAYNMSQIQQMIGQVAQKANPQTGDPMQNINPAGLPVGKKPPMNVPTSPMKPWQMPPPGQPQKPPLPAAGLISPQSGQPGPRAVTKPLPITTEGTLLPTGPAAPLGASQAQGAPPAKSFSDIEAEAAARAAKSGIGTYNQGGYTPISEDKQWSGQGYSGVDPREASTAPIADPAAPAPAPQGGKGGGQMVQADQFSPGGAAGGKSGGSPPEALGPPPADNGDIIQPAGDIGNTGGDQNLSWQGTGDYNPDVGGFDTFKPAYNQQEGTTSTVTGHNKDKGAQARIQDFTNQQLDAWLKAGGKASDFQRFNPELGSFKNYAKGEARHKARISARDKFYQDQLNALINARKPGAQ